MEMLFNKYFSFFFNVDLFNTWLREIFYPSTKEKIMLLLNSWTGHCERSVHEQKPEGKDNVLKSIPKGTTLRIQPLDVYGFRVRKNYVRHFSDDVLLYEENINHHLRNNIIKLQSLIHNQLSSSRYTNLFQYSWYKSEHVENRLGDFENPVDFASGENTQIKCAYCDQIQIVRCSWCKKPLCLKHLFHEYHYCDKYEP